MRPWGIEREKERERARDEACAPHNSLKAVDRERMLRRRREAWAVRLGHC